MNNEILNFDLIILGKGAAAFSAAIKASEMSNGEMRIAMIGMGPLGGTCVNVGCVPSKYLLEASHAIFKPERPKMAGIFETTVKHDFSKIMMGLRDYVNHARDVKYAAVIENYKNVKVFDGLGKFVDKKNSKNNRCGGKGIVTSFRFKHIDCYWFKTNST